ncbi:hypothetical protein PHIN3_63 [Sinorhizobium phage phiN3]|uniref:Uncharacterized protein n=1 Tax=Sinorhizobium phage phiN3 TaxID=1647405 RepID=A0A0F6SIZ8_9CAUD|nr:hypothetical protein AVT40_gp063 [Sinorhizobium phage phiN3]AKF13328.1 hypothetical protein PHIN3_63 [Sinorhizobium phage phiN3]
MKDFTESLNRTIAAQKKYGKMFCVYCESGTEPNCYCRPVALALYKLRINSTYEPIDPDLLTKKNPEPKFGV